MHCSINQTMKRVCEGVVILAAGAAALHGKVDFNREVRPILANHCFRCHGPDAKARKAKLRLDLPEGSTRDLGGYQAVEPGKPDESEMIVRITSRDPDELMPPPEAKKALTPKQIETLRKWIAEGGEYRRHWAFVKPRLPEPPKVNSDSRVRNPIDRFVLARLAEEGTSASPEADKATLLRRVSFDLTGLPPSLKELEAVVNKKDDELPSFGMSILPVIVPVVLISTVTFIGLFKKFGLTVPAGMMTGLEFIGDKNLAMMLGAIIAMYTLAKQRGWTLAKMGESMSTPLETAGVIILITGAGGAFGAMIAKTGLRGTIEELGRSSNSEGGMSTIGLLLIAWVLTAVIRAAQGSATVSMITGSSIMAPIIASGLEQGWLGCHPIYFCLIIGFGAFPLSWMNDSGFWVVQRMSGFTEKETLQTWTKLLTAIGIVGLVQTLIFATVLPLKITQSDESKSTKKSSVIISPTQTAQFHQHSGGFAGTR